MKDNLQQVGTFYLLINISDVGQVHRKPLSTLCASPAKFCVKQAIDMRGRYARNRSAATSKNGIDVKVCSVHLCDMKNERLK